MSEQVETVSEAVVEGVQDVASTTLKQRRSKASLVDRELVARLVGDARANGVVIDGEGGLLAELTKLVVEAALEGEMADHLGYDKHARGGSGDGKRPQRFSGEDGTDEGWPGRDRCAQGPGRHVHTGHRSQAAAPPRGD